MMSEIQHAAHREREEARVMDVINTECRNCGVVRTLEFHDPDPARPWSTETTVAYYHRISPQLARATAIILATFGVAVAFILHVVWPDSLASFIAFFGALFLVLAAVKTCTHVPITQEQLRKRIDVALEQAGFHVEQNATTWRITIKAPEDDEQ